MLSVNFTIYIPVFILLSLSLLLHEVSGAIFLESDLFSVIGSYVAPNTLLHLPEAFFTPMSSHKCIENWLTGLKIWRDKDAVNIGAARKLAARLGLDGSSKVRSLQLSSTHENRPAPWTRGLCVLLKQAMIQADTAFPTTAFTHWMFVPDDQALLFIFTCERYTSRIDGSTSKFDLSRNVRYEKDNLMVKHFHSKEEWDNVRLRSVKLSVSFLRHNRDDEPSVVLQVNDLSELTQDKVSAAFVFRLLEGHLWLRKLIKFHKHAKKQMLEQYKVRMAKRFQAHSNEWMKRMEEIRVWLEGNKE